MPHFSTPAVLLVLAQLSNIANAQLATAFSFTSWETTPLATYTFAGTLSNFNPPPECTTGEFFSKFSEITIPTGGTTRQYVRSYYSVGCHDDAPRSCCPSNWQPTGYYTSTGGSCPPGYMRMPSLTADLQTSGSIYFGGVISLRSGDAEALPCCPTVSFSHSRGSTSGVLIPRIMQTVTVTPSSGSIYTTVRCAYIQYDNYETYTVSGTTSSVFYEYLANALYIFDGDATQTVPLETSATSSAGSTSSTATPGSVTSSGAPGATSPPSQDQSGGKSGLSTGAIAGIAVGVAVPVIGIIAFLIYRLTRKNTGAAGPSSAWGNSGMTEVGGMEPGIADNPAEYGGITRSGIEKS
ncbi:hypothetical protein TWF281_003735 [Arthrobotrys megalospora]